MWNDLNSLNDRLVLAQEQHARVSKLEHRVAELDKEHKDCLTLVNRLKAQVAKEERDVERLEGVSLTGLFLNVLGSKDERLHKERQEALAAQLKYDEASRRLEVIAAELQRGRQELQASKGAGADYTSLLREKEAFIAQSGSRGSAELIRMAERTQELQWQMKELQEARAAGQRADSALAQVGDSLQSAQGWGAFDMLGGGLIATAVKHSRMDDARNQVHYAQQALGAFQRELKDVALAVHVDVVQLDGFSRFADFFFDNLITDWVIQSRINESLNSVRTARSQVGHLLGQVERRFRECQNELAGLEREKAAFVAQFQG